MDRHDLFQELLALVDPYLKNKDEKIRMKAMMSVSEIINKYASDIFVSEQDVKDYLPFVLAGVKDLYLVTQVTG